MSCTGISGGTVMTFVVITLAAVNMAFSCSNFERLPTQFYS
jgi:hypothetical protein